MRKKILIISNSLEIGGAEIYALTIANSFNKIGYKVFIASSGGELVSKLENGVEHIKIKSNAKKLDGILNASNAINKIVAKYNIDFIHSNSVLTCLMGKLGTIFKGIPIINTVHSWGANKNWISAAIVNLCASKVIAVSESTANHYIKNGLNRKKVVIIKNGIDTNRFCKQPEEKLESIRNELKITPNDFVIINIARMEEYRKGHNNLIEGAKIVIDKYPEVKFLLVGDGPLKNEVIKKVRNYNIDQNVIFTGYRNDIPELLSLAKVFCLPSKWEGLPLSIAEAMSCGLITIASNVSGIPEIITEAETGFLIPPDDPEALANKLIELIEKPEILILMKSNCIKNCKQNFNLESLIQKTDKLYQSI